MHRIDTPTAQIDKFGPGKNGFTNGDPATGRRATDLNSDMWDAVQEEMANAIEGNGITLDKSKHNQLYLAIQKAITDPGFLKKANNLSDVKDKAEGRKNLGVYSKGECDGRFANVRNNFAARMGVDRVLSGSNPPSSPGVWSVEDCSWTPEKWGTLLCTTNKTDLSTARGDGQFLHYFFLGHSSKLYVAVNVNNTGAGWQQLIGPAGGNLNGPVSSTSWLSAATLTAAYHTTTAGKAPEGGGMFSAQLDSKAAFYQGNFDWDVTAGGYYVPLVKGRSNRKGQGYPTAVSFGYLLDGSGSFARPCIHARGDNNKDAVWQFNPNDLMLYAPGGIKAGGATLAADGNIMGSRWGNKWLWDAIIEQVSGRVDWGSYNRDVGARATNDYVNGTFIKRIRLGPEEHIGANGAKEYHGPKVLAGFYNNDWDSTTEVMYWRPIQYLIGNNWIDVGFD